MLKCQLNYKKKISLTCKSCNTKHYLLDIRDSLKGIQEVCCKSCGRIIIPKYKQWK